MRKMFGYIYWKVYQYLDFSLIGGNDMAPYIPVAAHVSNCIDIIPSKPNDAYMSQEH